MSFLSKSRTHFSLKLFLVKIQLSYDKICSGKARKIFKIDFPSRLKGDPKKLKNPRVIWNLLTRPSWQLCTVWVVFFYSGKSWHGKKSNLQRIFVIGYRNFCPLISCNVHLLDQMAKNSHKAMSFYPDFVQILSWFCPNFIQIKSG